MLPKECENKVCTMGLLLSYWKTHVFQSLFLWYVVSTMHLFTCTICGLGSNTYHLRSFLWTFFFCWFVCRLSRASDKGNYPYWRNLWTLHTRNCRLRVILKIFLIILMCMVKIICPPVYLLSVYFQEWFLSVACNNDLSYMHWYIE